MVGVCSWLDWMILVIFSKLNDSMILWTQYLSMSLSLCQHRQDASKGNKIQS